MWTPGNEETSNSWSTGQVGSATISAGNQHSSTSWGDGDLADKEYDYLLNEDGTYLLQEDGSKIIINIREIDDGDEESSGSWIVGD